MRRVVICVALALASLAAGLTTARSATATHEFAGQDGQGPNGDSPFDEVVRAAGNHDTCGLKQNQLAAMMLAVTWHEVAGSATAEVPHPMTLGRYDTLFLPGSNEAFEANRNYYYNRDVAGHQRVFWHLGLGMWQYGDTNTYGSLLASGRFRSYDTVAKELSDRVCNLDAPGLDTDAELDRVFGRWIACGGSKCTDTYKDIYPYAYSDTNDHALVDVQPQNDVDYWGGIEEHTCRWKTETVTWPCYYVDAEGKADAQGHRGDWWAAPYDGEAGGHHKGPLARPFYIFFREVDGGKQYETRVWLQSPNGNVYADRPRGELSRETLDWHDATGLCDTTPNPDVGNC